MAQLALELSLLDVELIELLEPGTNTPRPEQSTSLETLTATKGENNLFATLTLEGTLPINSCGGGPCDYCACSCGGGC